MDLRNCDNMELMREFPDNYFDLAIVDPPYGIGFSDYERGGGSEKLKTRHTKNGKKDWDKQIPSDEYFAELFRVSKNQIIWGGNYFDLPPTQCFIFWYKQNPVDNFADGELAWTSFKRPAVCFDYRYYGNLQGKTSKEAPPIHPTQKPVQLYDFCLNKFAQPGYKVLDTNMGSGTIAIASYYFGCELTACEIDPELYQAARKHIAEKTIQNKLF